MERRTLVLLLAIATAIACAAAWLVLNPPGRRGAETSGSSTTSHPLPPFHLLAVEGNVDVTLVEGTTEGATVDLPSRGAATVTLEVRGDTLTVQGGESRRWWQRFGAAGARQPRVTVAFRQLDGISLAGNVRLRATSHSGPGADDHRQRGGGVAHREPRHRPAEAHGGGRDQGRRRRPGRRAADRARRGRHLPRCRACRPARTRGGERCGQSVGKGRRGARRRDLRRRQRRLLGRSPGHAADQRCRQDSTAQRRRRRARPDARGDDGVAGRDRPRSPASEHIAPRPASCAVAREAGSRR